MTNQIKNDTSRSEEGKCLWTANEGSEVLPPRCLHLYERTFSCEGNQFFSDRSLGVLILFFFSPLKQLSWETAVLEIHKEAVFSHFPSLLFLQLGWLTTLIRTTPKNASLRRTSIICFAPDPVLRRCHTITRNERLCSRFEPRDSQRFIVPPPPPRPQSSTSQTPQHLPPVGLRKPLPFIDFTSCPELCFFLCCARLTD